MKLYIFIRARVQRKKTSVHILQLYILQLALFALLVTHKEKRQSRMLVDLKRPEFAPGGVQAGSSSRTFHPEATGAGGKVQSKKLYRLKCKLLHLHGSPKISNTYFSRLEQKKVTHVMAPWWGLPWSRLRITRLVCE